MHKIIKATAFPNFTLKLTFDDGACGLVDVRSRLHGPIFEPLLDPVLFQQVAVDQFGAICWPNDADLSPDTLYADLALA